MYVEGAGGGAILKSWREVDNNEWEMLLGKSVLN